MKAMSKADMLAACLNTAHYVLFLYGAVAGTLEADITLALFVYITGLATLFLYASGSVAHRKQLAFVNTVFVGLTTFYSSVPLTKMFGVVGPSLKFAFSTAFNIGSTRHIVRKEGPLVDVRLILKKNIAMNFLAFAVNVAYAFL